jgi:hypothetical protein
MESGTQYQFPNSLGTRINSESDILSRISNGRRFFLDPVVPLFCFSCQA